MNAHTPVGLVVMPIIMSRDRFHDRAFPAVAVLQKVNANTPAIPKNFNIACILNLKAQRKVGRLIDASYCGIRLSIVFQRYKIAFLL
jgi:hypothetical protein